ncbi:MAG: BatD family protein, partial [Bacteroidetes bacterium]|nr:BatD family protein [Bacteroidota bacterium]MBU1423973.1 BatD family protein [Bacteroidota bacterium]
LHPSTRPDFIGTRPTFSTRPLIVGFAQGDADFLKPVTLSRVDPVPKAFGTGGTESTYGLVEKRVYRLISIFLIFIFTYSTAFSQDPNFTTSVDRNRIAMGEQFEITFTLSGSGKNFQPPPFSDFLVLSGPNQSTSTQFINGNLSQSISYSYILQPRSEGKFTIESATIESGGKRVQSNNIIIEVTKGSQQPQRQSQQSSEESNLSKQIAENLFLRVSVDKKNVYQGEQITATYKLYTRANIVKYSVTKVPSLTGFWAQEIDLPKTLQFETEVLNGIQFRVATVKKTALFPQRSGTLELDPMESEFVVQVQTRRRGGDVFDQFFNDPFFGNISNVNYKAKSEPLKINVKPLPTHNLPSSFSGAVGKFSMEAWIDKQETKMNEPVMLKVKISGRGNLKLIEPLKLSIPPDLESYEPKISDNITQGTNVISGSRTFEYLLIPRRPGDKKIPAFAFSYFDPEKNNYVSISSTDFIISTTKGIDLAVGSSASLSKEEIKLLGQDIRFIKSGDVKFRKHGKTFFGSTIYLTLLIAPVFLFIGFIYYQRRYEKITGDVVRLKSRKATKIAKKRLSVAKKLLESNNKGEFYTEVSRALWGYTGDKLGIPQANLTKESVNESLKSHGVSEKSLEKLNKILDVCEFAQYAPSADSGEMGKIYSNTVELISKIEEEIR